MRTMPFVREGAHSKIVRKERAELSRIVDHRLPPPALRDVVRRRRWLRGDAIRGHDANDHADDRTRSNGLRLAEAGERDEVDGEPFA